MIDIDPASTAGALLSQLRASIDQEDLAGQGLEWAGHVTVRYGILPDADLAGLGPPWEVPIYAWSTCYLKEVQYLADDLASFLVHNAS